MKKHAWTMVELTISLTIILIFSLFCIKVQKPNTQKAALFLYATMRNIASANDVIINKYGDLRFTQAVANKYFSLLMPNVAKQTINMEGREMDWYCVQLADLFNLDNSGSSSDSYLANAANCNYENKDDSDNINITFPNGVTIQGLTNQWWQPDANLDYYVKFIVVDIDGPTKGLNKVGFDRFPLMILSGDYQDTILPVNCLTNSLPTSNNGSTSRARYCGSKNWNSLTTNDIISFDLYRVDSADGRGTAKLIASNLSPLDADCGSGGGVAGFYNKSICGTRKLLKQCVTKKICESAQPDGIEQVQCTNLAISQNPPGDNREKVCMAILHKPSSGATFLVESLVGDLTAE